MNNKNEREEEMNVALQRTKEIPILSKWEKAEATLRQLVQGLDMLNSGESQMVEISKGVKLLDFASDGDMSVHVVFAEAGSEVTAHRHNESAELFWIKKGDVRIILDGVKHCLSDGDILLVPAGVEHHTKYYTETKHYIVAMPPLKSVDNERSGFDTISERTS